MAISSAGFVMTVSLVDSAGFATNRQYEMTAANYAAAVTDADTILTKLTAVTDGEVTGYSLTEVFNETDVTLPSAGIYRNNNALLSVRLVGVGNKQASLSIPMPKITLFVDDQGSNANIIDTNDVAVGAYVGLFQTGAQANVSDGEKVDELLRGKRVFRDIATTV